MSGNITSNNEYYYFRDVNTELLAKYAGALAVILALVTAFVRFFLRPRVLVNCWFCNTNSRVPPKEGNSWYCYNCKQYNGFLPNGDYNKELPEQRACSSRSSVSYAAKSKFSLDSNGLCDKCNANQEMKVRHLATFQALVPSNYEEELSIYRNQLESAYRLCQKCENIVAETLEKKKGLILGMNLKQSDKRTLQKLRFWQYFWPRMLHKLLVTLASLLSLISAVIIPAVKTLDLPLSDILQEHVQSNYSALLAASVLIQLLLTLSTGRKLPFTMCVAHVAVYLSTDQWGTEENASYVLGCLSGLTFLLTLLSWRKLQRGTLKIKKVEKQSINVRQYDREQRSFFPKANGTICTVRPPTPPTETGAVNSEKADFTLTSSVPAQPSAKSVTAEPQNPNTILSHCQDDSSSVDSAFSNHDSATLDNDSANDDVNSLIQSLKIGRQWGSKPVADRPASPRHEFQSRRYGRADKPLLNPPRLISTSPKSLNESSWVAGGFWQNQNDSFPNLTPPSEQPSRPGSPSSVYSQASSAWHSTMSRPYSPPSAMFDPLRTPSPFPVYTPPFGPPNGFHQPLAFQPYMYAPAMSPLWNSSVFPPISPAQNSASSLSCSSASTCGSVRRRRFGSDWDRSGTERDFASVSCSSLKPKRLNLLEALWQNSAIIFYTSAFYVAVTAAVLLFHKW